MVSDATPAVGSQVTLLEARGFHEGNSDHQGQYVIERAFVEK